MRELALVVLVEEFGNHSRQMGEDGALSKACRIQRDHNFGCWFNRLTDRAFTPELGDIANNVLVYISTWHLERLASARLAPRTVTKGPLVDRGCSV